VKWTIERVRQRFARVPWSDADSEGDSRVRAAVVV